MSEAGATTGKNLPLGAFFTFTPWGVSPIPLYKKV